MQKILWWLTSLMQFFKDFISQFDTVFFKRATKSAYNNIVRNPVISLSSVLVLTLILVLFHVTIALKFFAGESLTALNKKVDLIIEVQEDIEYYQVESMIERVKILKGVEEVTFVDKKEALISFLERHPNIQNFLTKYKLKNPLPSTIEIVTTEAQQLKAVIQILKESQYQDLITQAKLDTDLNQKERIERLIALGDFVKGVSFWFMMVFVVVSILVIFNTVNVAIHHKKEEIQIMDLVGATKLFIQVPFVLEGIMYCLIAIVFATFVNLGLHVYLSSIVQETLSHTSIAEGLNLMLQAFLYEYPSVIFFEFLLLFICSLISSFVAIEVYLKKHHI